jgi:anti-repressor protein
LSGFFYVHKDIRNVFVNGEPYFVGSDIAKALGYDQPHKAIQRHCRYGTKHTIPHPQSKTKQLEVTVIPESDVYRLIMSSSLPSAQNIVFETFIFNQLNYLMLYNTLMYF